MTKGRTFGERTAKFKREVIRVYGTVCIYCGEDIELIGQTNHARSFTTAHLYPVRDYPHLQWDIRYARPSHRRCNSIAGTKPIDEVIMPKPKTTVEW